MSELFYIDEEGRNVHTSQYLKNRGTCCRSNCLHCPYGTTLKSFGLQFESVDLARLDLAKEISAQGRPTEDVASMLLSSAFGGQKKQKSITEQNLNSFRFVLLKERICGLVEVSSLSVTKLYLKEHFKDQGLDQDTVQSYFQEASS